MASSVLVGIRDGVLYIFSYYLVVVKCLASQVAQLMFYVRIRLRDFLYSIVYLLGRDCLRVKRHQMTHENRDSVLYCWLLLDDSVGLPDFEVPLVLLYKFRRQS